MLSGDAFDLFIILTPVNNASFWALFSVTVTPRNQDLIKPETVEPSGMAV